VNPKIRDLLLIPLCAAMLVLTTAGFRSCSAAEERSVERSVVSGIDTTARAVAPGVEAVRALREAGKIEPAAARALARAALDANAAVRTLAQSALDGADAPTLAAQLDAAVTLAGRLERDGTLRLKNGDTRLAFKLGVITAKNGLVAARGHLNRPGLTFTLDDGTRRKLTELMPVFAENERVLKEAVERLTGP
jgi:hypothetical protein